MLRVTPVSQARVPLKASPPEVLWGAIGKSWAGLSTRGTLWGCKEEADPILSLLHIFLRAIIIPYC